MMKKLVAFVFAIMICNPSFAADSIIVEQPAYHSMSFYVHKPVNLPKDFYVTYDGYLVYKNEKGIWYYGSAEKDGIIRTDYVVGSVIPSVVRLKPYNTHISSVAPILNSPSARVFTPPTSPLYPETPVIYRETTPPAWTGNQNFMAIERWKKSVDRIGVTNNAIPVAWKGDYPDVIYAWTGNQWRQLNARAKHVPAVSTLRAELYDLTLEIKRTNSPSWTLNDSRVLSQYARQWGYKWIGLVQTNGGLR